MILTLPFLGERKYLQGTTLLEALLLQANMPRRFSFKIQKTIFSNRIEIGSAGEPSAVLNCDDQTLFVTALVPLPPVRREAFDEQALAPRIQKQDGRFCLPADAAQPVRGMVALFKHVLRASFPAPSRPGRWAFVRLDATQLFESVASCIAIEKIFCRDGMARCSVLFDHLPAATLYFAWADLEEGAA